jgi:hypothetical protein
VGTGSGKAAWSPERASRTRSCRFGQWHMIRRNPDTGLGRSQAPTQSVTQTGRCPAPRIHLPLGLLRGFNGQGGTTRRVLDRAGNAASGVRRWPLARSRVRAAGLAAPPAAVAGAQAPAAVAGRELGGRGTKPRSAGSTALKGSSLRVPAGLWDSEFAALATPTEAPPGNGTEHAAGGGLGSYHGQVRSALLLGRSLGPLA